MATEEILMAGVQAGGDRQELHERIRRTQPGGGPASQRARPSRNDLLDRLKADSALCQGRLVVRPSTRCDSSAARRSRWTGSSRRSSNRFANGMLQHSKADCRNEAAGYGVWW